MKRALLLIVRLCIAAALLAWLFRRAGGLLPVWLIVRAARPELVVLAFVLTFVTQAVISHRLRLLAAAQGADLSTREVLAINLTTVFYGLFLPGGGVAAIAIRFYRLTRTDRRYAAMLIALIADRILATASVCAAGLGFWLLDGPQRSMAAVIVLMMASLPCLIAMLPMVAATPARWVAIVASYIPGVRGLRPRTETALAAFRTMPLQTQVELAVLSLGAHAVGTLVYALLARSLSIDIPFVAFGWMRSVSALVTLIPISISGLGLREGTTVAMLAERGVPHTPAFAFSLLVFGVTILAIGLVGGLVELTHWFAPRPATEKPPLA